MNPQRSMASSKGDSQLPILQRSYDVLWSLSPRGIVLHATLTGKFLELDEDGYRLWAYLDGARSADVAITLCAQARPNSARCAVKLRKVVGVLHKNGFVVQRS